METQLIRCRFPLELRGSRFKSMSLDVLPDSCTASGGFNSEEIEMGLVSRASVAIDGMAVIAGDGSSGSALMILGPAYGSTGTVLDSIDGLAVTVLESTTSHLNGSSAAFRIWLATKSASS